MSSEVNARPIPPKSGPLSVWTTAAKGWMGMVSPFSPTSKGTQSKPLAKVWYQGDGTVAQHWPDQEEWKNWEESWDANKVLIDQTSNSPEETQDLYDSILEVSNSTDVDARFILATIMQESKGDVRVTTTAVAVENPGLMQAFGPIAKGTCKDVSTTERCPKAMIKQMIMEGTATNSEGMSLHDLLTKSGVSDVSKYYKATRLYNSGPNSIPADKDLSSKELSSTYTYASDVANRLTGWVG
ncbi:putative Lysozyme-like domain superfamily protein [Septoria linicola]|nr:putative Lysozyme-like domain superfamily protein [Septoria linicola]